MGEVVPHDAIILAGGSGSRLGGVAKSEVRLGGRRLLDAALDAAALARACVVVGPVAVPGGVRVTREDPPGTGPAAGLAAGLAVIEDPSPFTLVLACDLPGAPDAVPFLLEAAAAGEGASDGWCLARADDGRPEWLLAVYRTPSLTSAFAAFGDPRNRGVRQVLAPLSLVCVPGPLGVGDDVDTWADHDRWAARLADRRTMDEDRSSWRPFVERACAAVGVDSRLVDADEVLALTRRIAQAGVRPMAPVAAYILGLALGAHPDADPVALRAPLERAIAEAPAPPKDER